MTKRLIILATVLCTLSVVCIAAAKTSKNSDSGKLTSSSVLRLMRALDTAEAEARASAGSFVPLEQLLGRRFFRDNQPEIALTDSSSGVINDYKLSVVVSSDGARFRASLMPGTGCGIALFSDESYVIYQGHALGCPNEEIHEGPTR